MTPLDRKLIRDLWRMKGQAIAISVVIAMGVMLLIMMDGLVNSLEETKQAYYERYRLADIFSPVKRAPDHLLAEIAKIPGVSSVEGRVNGSALINLPEIKTPLRAQTVSQPDIGTPRLNDIYLSAGRRINPNHKDEILLLEGFAKVHGLEPGDKLSATMNGSRRSFQIVGLAQSPEFLFSAPPGEFMPDDSRFAVIWMSKSALAATYDMKGAFNEALLSVSRGSKLSKILARVDRILSSSGGIGAYALLDHNSNRFIQEEINGLKLSSRGVPPLFLAVAAFLLNIVVSRMLQTEREQIGLLKAFGYSSFEIGVHYFKFILAIAIGGALLGCIMGILSGRSLLVVYQAYYKFPFLIFQVDSTAFFIGIVISILSASAGGVFVLRQVFALTPSTAMRPPAPADYSRSASLNKTLKFLLDQPTRMVIRQLTRQPARAIGAIVGISAGMALSVGMLSVLSSFDRTLDLNFNIIDRSDLTVSFNNALSNKILFELKSINGVIEVEPFRNVAAIMRNGFNVYRGGVNGLVELPRLNRAVDKDLESIRIAKGGIILGAGLAKTLNIKTNDILTVDVREGRRPVLRVPVVGVAETLIGSPAYMHLSTLNRSLGEPGRISGAHLRIDSSKGPAIYQTIKNLPSVSGVSLKKEARAAFKKIIDSGAGAIRYVMAAIAGIITFGIVYNSARIAFAERARDLASLRVIGFTKNETAFVLLAELAIITLISLPVGSILGYYLSFAISKGFSTDLYQIPTIFSPESFGFAAIAVLTAVAISGWLVKRDINTIDLVSSLKTRE
jgi:putative ABC transport system permease protein